MLFQASSMTKTIFSVLERAWAKNDCVLVDMKVRGRHSYTGCCFLMTQFLSRLSLGLQLMAIFFLVTSLTMMRGACGLEETQTS